MLGLPSICLMRSLPGGSMRFLQCTAQYTSACAQLAAGCLECVQSSFMQGMCFAVPGPNLRWLLHDEPMHCPLGSDKDSAKRCNNDPANAAESPPRLARLRLQLCEVPVGSGATCVLSGRPSPWALRNAATLRVVKYSRERAWQSARTVTRGQSPAVCAAWLGMLAWRPPCGRAQHTPHQGKTEGARARDSTASLR